MRSRSLVQGPGVHFGSWEGARGWRVCIAVRHSDCTRSTFGAGVSAHPLCCQELRAVVSRMAMSPGKVTKPEISANSRGANAQAECLTWIGTEGSWVTMIHI